LFILQTTNAKRSAQAAISCAVQMVTENQITEREALLGIDAQQINKLLYLMIDPSFDS
jgi:pyruvate, orthophosphate dikinase